MGPTLSSGEYVLVSRLAYRLRPPARGDIVLLRDPWILKGDYVKRIVGLPGEYVTLDEGNVSIGGRRLPEPYRGEGVGLPSYGDWMLGPDEYLVMGDNRQASRDSRFFGPIGRDRLVGRAWLRYWPGRAHRL